MATPRYAPLATETSNTMRWDSPPAPITPLPASRHGASQTAASRAHAATGAANSPAPRSTTTRRSLTALTAVLLLTMLALSALQVRNEVEEQAVLDAREEFVRCVLVMGTSPRAAERGCAAVSAANPATTSLEPAPDSAAPRTERSAVRLALARMREAASRRSADEAPTFCLPSTWGVSVAAYLAEARAENAGEGVCSPLVFVEDGRDAAFDRAFSASESWARLEPEPEQDTEDWIDEQCFARRKRIPGLGVPCTVREVPVLRAARKWAVLTEQALSAPGVEVRVLESEPVAARLDLPSLSPTTTEAGTGAGTGGGTRRRRLPSRADARAAAPAAVDLSEFTFDPDVPDEVGLMADVDAAPPDTPSLLAALAALPLHAAHRLSHRELVRDLLPDWLAHAALLDRVGATPTPPPSPPPPLRDRPLLKPVDAGSCWKLPPPRPQSGVFARCLPTLLIIGAQKAGTDELAVWLNFNEYQRRLDGGPETHFFDCVGRGRGQTRDPCFRGRNMAMAVYQHSPRYGLNSNDTTGGYWSWDRFRRESRFNRVDELWPRYARLGQLNKRGYYLRPSRALMFEKSPSYSDLADVRDVARLLPSVKLVFLTRDPVARLYSSYWQMCLDADKERRARCGVDDYERLVHNIVRGVDDVDKEMHRAAAHGFYGRVLRPWLERFTRKNQIFVVDAHLFHFFPTAVVYAIESVVGNRGAMRHHAYKPRWENGYWTLGEYSKATHPSHDRGREPSANVTAMLTKWYEPHILEYVDLLAEFDDVVALGGTYEAVPDAVRALHPDLFRAASGRDAQRFVHPPWVDHALRATGRLV